MSNGGFFTARLVCEMSDRIAAAVSVAGLYHPPECTPARAVPYQGIHGTDDEIVPFNGSGESALLAPDSPPQWRVFFEQVIPDEFAEFAADAGCEAPTTGTPVGDDVVRYDYSNCEDTTPMTSSRSSGADTPGPARQWRPWSRAGSATPPMPSTPRSTAGRS